MKKWLITPREPLIFRNGKPFTAAPGSRSETLPLPFPSTLAGAVRTRSGTDQEKGLFDYNMIESLLDKTILGPIVVELNQDDNTVNYFFPAPADAIFFKTDNPEEADRYDLKPLKLENAQVDLAEYSICGPARIIKEKPHSNAPSFWQLDQFMDWCQTPLERELVKISEVGISGLTQETRTHVGINASTQVAEEGALFQTSGLEFQNLPRKDIDPYLLSLTKRLALLVLTDADFQEGIGHLGGERRIVNWHKKDTLKLPFESCPEDLRDRITSDGYCRLILITPACFTQGHLPEWLCKKYEVSIKAVINKRYQGVSGWDYKKRLPKPSKRLTPAGSVYFLKLPESPEKRKNFIDDVWMHTISDDHEDPAHPSQYRNDGFGLALLGIWDGKTREMKLEEQKDA
jgi:CRISPR-associated protein Cmr3